ncbi:DUF362 domain-containing protein [candidate division GN15 bacterium]|nr:DUF362 domain-containing protein [candidate division GN15 bacterium]
MSEPLISTVAVAGQAGYDPDLIERRLEGLFQVLDRPRIRPGRPPLALVKPDLEGFTSAGGQGTHPEITAAVARLLRARGYRVAIGESLDRNGGGRGDWRRRWGYQSVIDRDSLEVCNFNESPGVAVSVGPHRYYLAGPVGEADLVVSLPKLRFHPLNHVAGALSSLIDFIPTCHRPLVYRRISSPQTYGAVLIDLLYLIQPDITVLDAVGQVRDRGGVDRSVGPINRLIASTDPVAVDVVASQLTGLAPDRVASTRLAADAGLGNAWLEIIRLVGESRSALRRSYQLHRRNGAGQTISSGTAAVTEEPDLRPTIDIGRCTGCRDCVSACPTQALTVGGDCRPVVHAGKCIGCLSCHDCCRAGAVRAVGSTSALPQA